MNDPQTAFADATEIEQQSLYESTGGKAAGFVRYMAGALLIGAAVLKVHELTITPYRIAVVDMLLVNGQWLLGLWLISGLYRRIARLVTVIVFLIFAVYTAVLLYTGAESCGCFGAISVPPWITLILDLTMVTLLILCRPPSGMTSPVIPRLFSRGVMVVAITGCIAFTLWATQQDDARLTVPTPDEVFESKYQVDLGYIEPASEHQGTFVIANNQDHPLQIKQYIHECICTTLQASPDRIPARSAVTLPLLFKAPSNASVYAKRIVLLTDSIEQPRIELVVSARIGLPLTTMPDALTIEDSDEPYPRAYTLRIRNDAAEEHRLLYALANDRAVVTHIPADNKIPARSAIEVAVTVTARPTRSRSTITIHTSAPHQRTLRVRVADLESVSTTETDR